MVHCDGHKPQRAVALLAGTVVVPSFVHLLVRSCTVMARSRSRQSALLAGTVAVHTPVLVQLCFVICCSFLFHGSPCQVIDGCGLLGLLEHVPNCRSGNPVTVSLGLSGYGRRGPMVP